jgi:hypothetical protein
MTINRASFINKIKDVVKNLEGYSDKELTYSDLEDISLSLFGCSLEKDEDGQLVIYTSMKQGFGGLENCY